MQPNEMEAVDQPDEMTDDEREGLQHQAANTLSKYLKSKNPHSSLILADWLDAALYEFFCREERPKESVIE